MSRANFLQARNSEFFPLEMPEREEGSRARLARRRGVSMYMFVLALPMIFGTLGIVIDLGHESYQKNVAGKEEFGMQSPRRQRGASSKQMGGA